MNEKNEKYKTNVSTLSRELPSNHPSLAIAYDGIANVWYPQ